MEMTELLTLKMFSLTNNQSKIYNNIVSALFGFNFFMPPKELRVAY